MFGEADAEGMDAEPDSEPAVDDVGMDVEGDALAVSMDGGITVDDDDHNVGPLCVLQPLIFLVVKH